MQITNNPSAQAFLDPENSEVEYVRNVVLLQYCAFTKLLCYRNHIIWMELVTIV